MKAALHDLRRWFCPAMVLSFPFGCGLPRCAFALFNCPFQDSEAPQAGYSILRTIRQQDVAADGSRRILLALKMAPTAVGGYRV